MSDILFADGRRYSREWLDTHDAEAQAILARHKGTNPLCLCQQNGIPMHIRELHLTHRFYLARMPRTGPSHAPHCPAYEPIHGKADQEARDNGLIEELADGRWALKVGVGFGVRDNSAWPPPEAHPAELPQMIENRVNPLGLLAILQILWERAELHHWHPKMMGRRRYKQVQARLVEAAEQIVIRGFPLSHRLYIPEPFRKEEATEIEARRLETLARLGRSANGQRRRYLVLGQLREVQKNADIAVIKLAHVSNSLRLHLPVNTWNRLAKRWQCEMNEGEEGADKLVFGLFLVDGHAGSTLKCRAAAMMVTTTHFIPVFRPPERALAYGLVESGRHFIKMLPLDGRPSENGASFLLTDTGNGALPLYITDREPPDASATDEWYWHTQEQELWPPLPAARSRSVQH